MTARHNRPLVAGVLLVAIIILWAALAATAYSAGMNGSMTTARTLKAGASECYRPVATVTSGEAIMVLARTENSSWVFVWSEAGDGWAPTSSVRLDGAVSSLPVWTNHFMGERCVSQPARQQFDSRICGRAGNDTTATTTRWTDIYSTADPDFDTNRAYPTGTTLTLVGRDSWGCWVRVRSTTSAGNGWVPVQALDTRDILGLPIAVDNSGGCQIVNGQITGCDNSEENTQGDIRTVTGRTVIYNEPNTSAPTERFVPVDGRVRVVSERPGWVRIRSRYGNGYIKVEQLQPANPNDALARMNRSTSLYGAPDFDSGVVGSVAANEDVTVVAFASGWIKVKSSANVEGWVPSNSVARR